MIYQMGAKNLNQPEDYRIQFKDEQKWKNYLKQNGFVVIKNWVDKKICEKYMQSFWDVLQKFSQGKLNKNDIKTQKDQQNYPFYGALIGLGHTKFQWELRKLCKPIFQRIWGTNDLKCSFDGLCFMNGLREYQELVLHSDQAPAKDYLWGYQGVMTLTDNFGPNDGGFCVIPKSNNFHQQYFSIRNPNSPLDFQPIDQQDSLLKPFGGIKKINNMAGDFILFDSRSFHSNRSPKTQILRACTYICMIPTSRIPPHILEQRVKIFKHRKSTNHYPGQGIRISGQGKECQVINQISIHIPDQEMEKMI